MLLRLHARPANTRRRRRRRSRSRSRSAGVGAGAAPPPPLAEAAAAAAAAAATESRKPKAESRQGTWVAHRAPLCPKLRNFVLGHQFVVETAGLPVLSASPAQPLDQNHLLPPRGAMCSQHSGPAFRLAYMLPGAFQGLACRAAVERPIHPIRPPWGVAVRRRFARPFLLTFTFHGTCFALTSYAGSPASSALTCAVTNHDHARHNDRRRHW